MADNYLFFTNEGSDKLMLVMTRERLKSTIATLQIVDEEWQESHDFAYLALSGGLAKKGEVDDETQKD